MRSTQTEEGIDVGTCNLVIRFSDLQNNREFVQSKGRARARGSFYVILHDDKRKTNELLDQFHLTEMFLKGRFQKNEQLIKEQIEERSVLPDDHQVTYESKIFQMPSGSSVYHNKAAAFLQRYIRENGDKNCMVSCEFEPPEEEPCLAKLNLIGVTPLKEKVKGEVHKTKKDAFKSGRSILFEPRYSLLTFCSEC